MDQNQQSQENSHDDHLDNAKPQSFWDKVVALFYRGKKCLCAWGACCPFYKKKTECTAEQCDTECSKNACASKKCARRMHCIGAIVFNLILTLSVIALFSDSFEPYFAPSTTKIRSLQKAIEQTQESVQKISQKEDENTAVEAQFKMDTQNTIAILREEITRLQSNIKLLEEKASALQMQQTSSGALGDASKNAMSEQGGILHYSDLKSAWIGLTLKVAKGDTFDRELGAMQSLVHGDDALRLVLKSLIPYATLTTKPADLLSKELAIIKGKMIFSDATAATAESMGLFATLWHKLKNLVRIESKTEDGSAVKGRDSVDLSRAVSEIDNAIILLRDNKIKEALSIVKELHTSAQSYVATWIETASQRLVLEDKIAEIEKMVGPYISSIATIQP